MLNDFKNKQDELKPITITADKCLETLTDDEKNELIANKTTIEFEVGETIIKHGFVANNIMYIEEGLAKLEIMTDGKMAMVNLISPKSFIGIVCTFANHNVSFSATALEKTTISIIDMSLFEKFTRQNGDFAFHIIRHMSIVTNDLVHKILRYSHKNIEGAVSILLSDFSKVYKSDDFTLPIKRIEMAKMLGYSKESVINTISKFNKEGILEVHEKHIKILDKTRLLKIAKMS
ncbi:MAG: Crp/Fnr family transcriptional regulator [Flavobacteriaceae bacterium]|nr:Crp/Fnr family transcriptional regulator [Flavobacteriaceae bacterium]